MRVLTPIAILACAFLVLCPVMASAQTSLPEALRAGCAVPDAPPRVVRAVPVVTPTAAKDVSGDVIVVVTLDEQSNVVKAAIQKSPSVLLNDAALAAARGATFQTRISACRPLAESYLFYVRFDGANAFVAPRAMTDVFLGKWQCSTDDHPRIVEDFHTGSEGTTVVGVSSIFDSAKRAQSRAQSYGFRNGTIGVTEQTGAQIFRALSTGWNGNELVFIGKTWNDDTGVTLAQRMTFIRSGRSEFVRTIETAPAPAGPWTPAFREQCQR